MITCEDITVYVASRRSKPPKLPLREALVTVAVECVYETNKVAPGKRKKVVATLRNFLKGKDGKGLKCTHYGYAQDSKELADMGLDTYLNANVANTYANSNFFNGADPENTRSTTSSLTMTLALLDADKADSRRNRQRLWQQNNHPKTGFQSIGKRAHGDMARKYKNAAQMAMMAAFTQDLEDPKDQVDFVFDIDEHMETSSFELMDAPSLASTDDGTDNENLNDIEAMPVNTNVLVSGEHIDEIEAIHQAECLIADFDGKSTMLWIDNRDKMEAMSALLMDWKSPEDPPIAQKKVIKRMEIGKKSTDIRIGREKNMGLSRKKSNDGIMGQEIEVNSEKNMIEDMSTIFDSTCSVMCPTYGAVTLPDDHDLDFMVHIEEDLKNLDNPGKNNINQCPKALLSQPLLRNEHDLFGMLVDLTTQVEDVKCFLNDMPDALQHERVQDGRLPLHVLCDRCLKSPSLLRLPDAKSEELHSMITSCIEEITQHRLLLKLLVWSYKDACLKLDANGDLAIHLLGRRLVVWTASLQIFTKLATMDVTHLERMMTVSQIITESIDIVSRPLCSAKMNVCDKPGSCGSMLPLHINIIFGGSMDVFRLLLETFPQGVLTLYFFPEEGFPISTLQLQKMIKSDQRLYRQKLSYAQNLSEGEDKPLSWHSTIPSNFYEEDIERRIDFMFCVDPESLIEDEIRSNRIMRLIRDEVKQDIGLWKDGLSPSINNIWAWICSQESIDYVSYIKDITKNLKKSHFEKLANAPLGNKPSSFDPVIVASRFEVRKALMYSKRVSKANCFPSHESIENYEGGRNQNCLFSIRDHTSIADLAWATKAVFGIKAEDSQCIPVHFVVFPFPLENHESNEDRCINDQVSVAESERKLDILFSNWMMNAISPGTVLAGLQEKITSSQPLNIPTTQVDTPLHKKQKKYKEDEEWGALMSLYQNGGYLYFIDEEKGTIVNKPSSGFSDTTVNSSNGSKENDVTYPIFLPDAAQQVQVLLPLMRMGMILMRKTDSVSILSQILIQHMEKCDVDTTRSNKNGNTVYCSSDHPSSWTAVSRELILHLQEKANNIEYVGEKEESSIVILETNTMRNKLQKFLASPQIHSNEEVVGLDWSKELSLLKNIICQTGHYAEMISQLSIQKKKLSSIKYGYVWTARKRKGQHFDDEDIDEKLIGSEKRHSDVSKTIYTKSHDDLDSIINDVAYDDDDIFERLFAAQQETSDLTDLNHADSSEKNLDYNKATKRKLLTSSTVEDEASHENKSIYRNESDGNFSQAKRKGHDDERRYGENNAALAQEWWK